VEGLQNADPILVYCAIWYTSGPCAVTALFAVYPDKLTKVWTLKTSLFFDAFKCVVYSMVMLSVLCLWYCFATYSLRLNCLICLCTWSWS